MNNKKRKIIYWLFTGIVAFIFIASGLFKLLGGDKALEMAKGLGGQNNLMILGVLELAIAVLWLIPRTGVAATLLAVAYIGGAMAVHFVTNQSVLVPVIIQVLIWIAAAYRFNELWQRLSLSNSKNNFKSI